MHTNNNTNLPMQNVLLMVGTIVLMFAFLHVGECAKKQKEFVEKVYDVKDFKKLLRTRKNVLVVFMKTARAGTKTYDEFNNAAKR
ncbi:hypothetical protein EB796_003340 [Bugula neritina]|uniref:Uncharacterized protein n=1 Tax=Bugula neritina TaxID=10212 RepID=A0A7J7KKE6_BUGNE|nr:hypothetical protein EB796_003340 [Bugula neritina]